MQKQDVSLIDLNYIDDTFPILNDDIIIRDNYITQIEKKLENNSVLFIKGENGIGKTTLLTSFAKTKSTSAISHFVSANDLFTYSTDFLRINLARQIHFYSTNEDKEEVPTDDTFSNLQIPLRRKIRNDNKNNKFLYFIFDGFHDLPDNDLENLGLLIKNIPFNISKFIISCNEKTLNEFIPKNTQYTSLDILNFGIIETEHYFKEITEKKNFVRKFII